MNRSLQDALDRARYERPRPLTAGFSDEVMAQIAQVSDEPLRPLSWKGFMLAAAAAVVAAAAVSVGMTDDGGVSERPSLVVFGASAGDSLFGSR
jgi:hypothetical protein